MTTSPRLETLEPRWHGPIIVAATGASLTKEVAAVCMASGRPIIAIKQAALRLPTADVVYAVDSWWWDHYQGMRKFAGERWSSHNKSIDFKLHAAETHGLRLVQGERVAAGGFSTDPKRIHYANNAGFQAVGMAIHWLHKPGRIVLVGFDMQGEYFFGDHPKGKAYGKQFPVFIQHFEKAAKALPEGVEIVLGTPSALKCFPAMPLSEALAMKAAA